MEGLQDIRLKGTAPADTSTFDLNALAVSEVETQDTQASAHVHLEMNKVAANGEVDASFVVDQDVALVQVGDQWLISGADAPKIQDKL